MSQTTLTKTDQRFMNLALGRLLADEQAPDLRRQIARALRDDQRTREDREARRSELRLAPFERRARARRRLLVAAAGLLVCATLVLAMMVTMTSGGGPAPVINSGVQPFGAAPDPDNANSSDATDNTNTPTPSAGKPLYDKPTLTELKTRFPIHVSPDGRMALATIDNRFYAADPRALLTASAHFHGPLGNSSDNDGAAIMGGRFVGSEFIGTRINGKWSSLVFFDASLMPPTGRRGPYTNMGLDPTLQSLLPSPDGKHLAVDDGDDSEVWTADGQRLNTVDRKSGLLGIAGWTADGQLLAYTADGLFRLTFGDAPELIPVLTRDALMAVCDKDRKMGRVRLLASDTSVDPPRLLLRIDNQPDDGAVDIPQIDTAWFVRVDETGVEWLMAHKRETPNDRLLVCPVGSDGTRVLLIETHRFDGGGRMTWLSTMPGTAASRGNSQDFGAFEPHDGFLLAGNNDEAEHALVLMTGTCALHMDHRPAPAKWISSVDESPQGGFDVRTPVVSLWQFHVLGSAKENWTRCLWAVSHTEAAKLQPALTGMLPANANLEPLRGFPWAGSRQDVLAWDHHYNRPTLLRRERIVVLPLGNDAPALAIPVPEWACK